MHIYDLINLLCDLKYVFQVIDGYRVSEARNVNHRAFVVILRK